MTYPIGIVYPFLKFHTHWAQLCGSGIMASMTVVAWISCRASPAGYNSAFSPNVYFDVTATWQSLLEILCHDGPQIAPILALEWTFSFMHETVYGCQVSVFVSRWPRVGTEDEISRTHPKTFFSEFSPHRSCSDTREPSASSCHSQQHISACSLSLLATPVFTGSFSFWRRHSFFFPRVCTSRRRNLRAVPLMHEGVFSRN
jgi:hypothetical protein